MKRLEYFSKLPGPSWEIFGAQNWHIKVDRSRIKDYVTPGFARQLSIWLNVRKWGWPNGGGWAQQQAPLLELVNMWNAETDEYQEQEERRGSGKSQAGYPSRSR